MPTKNEYDATWDLDILRQADEIKKNPARLENIKKVAEERLQTVETLTGAKRTSAPNFEKDGFIVLKGSK